MAVDGVEHRDGSSTVRREDEHPSNSHVWYYLANRLFQLGAFRDSRKALLRAIDLRPEEKEYQDQLALITRMIEEDEDLFLSNR
ncbi:MAG: tetratricopeptide repeat protein [Candidatus Thorarchaeota archaeon]|nr:MAG: tetratricopeptide repeat protein [Candidatus Thorarchaeota archaeon]